jgi:hypothetical protein
MERTIDRVLAERSLHQGIRLSHENFTEFGAIQTIPLYAAANLVRSFP